MKVLIVSQFFSPENFRINDLTKALIERGHEVQILTGKPTYPDAKRFANVDLHSHDKKWLSQINLFRVTTTDRKRSTLSIALNFLTFVFSASVFALRKIKKDDVDIIFAFAPSPITAVIPAIILSKKIKKPVVAWVQDLWPDAIQATDKTDNKLILGATAKMVRWIYRNCNLVLGQSEAFVSEIQKMERRATTKLFYNWSEGIFFDIRLTSQKKGGRYFEVLFAGNLGASQDLLTIVEAANILRNEPRIRWTIAGSGVMRSKMEEAVAEQKLSDKVRFLGQIDLEQMPNVYANSDALLITFKDNPLFHKTIPARVQSALASGKPIIAALDGETRSIIDKQTCGMTCPSSNPKKLAEAVLKMMRLDPETRLNMGLRGREFARLNFNREIQISQLEKYLIETKKKE